MALEETRTPLNMSPILLPGTTQKLHDGIGGDLYFVLCLCVLSGADVDVPPKPTTDPAGALVDLRLLIVRDSSSVALRLSGDPIFSLSAARYTIR